MKLLFLITALFFFFLSLTVSAYQEDKLIVVKKRDTLGEILRSLGLSPLWGRDNYVEKISSYNLIINSNKIKPGDLILIPSFDTITVTKDEQKNTQTAAVQEYAQKSPPEYAFEFTFSRLTTTSSSRGINISNKSNTSLNLNVGRDFRYENIELQPRLSLSFLEYASSPRNGFKESAQLNIGAGFLSKISFENYSLSLSSDLTQSPFFVPTTSGVKLDRQTFLKSEVFASRKISFVDVGAGAVTATRAINSRLEPGISVEISIKPGELDFSLRYERFNIPGSGGGSEQMSIGAKYEF